jgi:3-methylcrotonyl-CoA carboxylase beta subunit
VTVLPNAIDPTSESFLRNQAHNLQLVRELREHAAAAALGGPPAARERHQKRGKLLARDRIEYLLDPGSPFL